ncbi:MAG TPA: helical backbone metal receptor [Candidatus Baltobacteraceae bacterium]|nr:helical backbone metal receptor [Candidatus Baltobacteraceae bacterium]
MLTACAPRHATITIVDDSPPPPAKRIVSLIPSLTEDLFALGVGGRVVGVSQYSDYPPAARKIAVVSTFASLNAERIVALHPDLVVGIQAQHDLTKQLDEVGLRTLLLRDDSLDDVYADIFELGRYTGTLNRAGTLIERLRTRTAALRARAEARKTHPSVFVVLGTAPIFTVGEGSYIASLIALAGGRDAAADLSAPYARYSAEALVARQPDILVVDPDVPLKSVLREAPWSALHAVRAHRIYTLPDAAILERPGPRYNEGLSWLETVIARSGR